jgi:hypothetical protein
MAPELDSSLTPTTNNHKPKRNPDYSASAERLTQSPFIKALLDDMLRQQADADRLKSLLNAYAEWAELQQINDTIAAIRRKIEESLPEHGGYQDVENGHYALRQRAVTVTYLPGKVHDVLPPQLQAAVIVESVDKGTVEALVKAGRITPEQ